MMSHADTSRIFPSFPWNILLLFRLMTKLCVDGLCLLRSLMVFQGEIPRSKTPLQLWLDWVTFDGRV